MTSSLLTITIALVYTYRPLMALAANCRSREHSQNVPLFHRQNSTRLYARGRAYKSLSMMLHCSICEVTAFSLTYCVLAARRWCEMPTPISRYAYRPVYARLVRGQKVLSMPCRLGGSTVILSGCGCPRQGAALGPLARRAMLLDFLTPEALSI
jgi:hypothetical protein